VLRRRVDISNMRVIKMILILQVWWRRRRRMMILIWWSIIVGRIFMIILCTIFLSLIHLLLLF
jgi:hypothetical protein